MECPKCETDMSEQEGYFECLICGMIANFLDDKYWFSDKEMLELRVRLASTIRHGRLTKTAIVKKYKLPKFNFLYLKKDQLHLLLKEFE